MTNRCVCHVCVCNVVQLCVTCQPVTRCVCSRDLRDVFHDERERDATETRERRERERES